MSDQQIAIAARLADWRRRNKMTQKQLAALAGVHRATIEMIERAASSSSIAVWIKIATATGVSLDWFIFGKGEA